MLRHKDTKNIDYLVTYTLLFLYQQRQKNSANHNYKFMKPNTEPSIAGENMHKFINFRPVSRYFQQFLPLVLIPFIRLKTE